MQLPSLRKIILTYFSTTIFSCSFGQTVKSLKPTLGTANNYSKQEQEIWQDVLKIDSKINAGDLDYDYLSPKDKALIDSLENGYGPVTEIGCSWYCGGEMYKVTSDSYLKAQGNVNYKPENIHDFNLFTAWVPDTTQGAIGKKINFHFKPLSPRVSEIIIYNGYIKNYDLFKSNSRVKKFKLYINNVPYAILNVGDTTASQTFKIGLQQSKDMKKDLILTLEILEIYKGTKSNDVVISEINFNGIDVH